MNQNKNTGLEEVDYGCKSESSKSRSTCHCLNPIWPKNRPALKKMELKKTKQKKTNKIKTITKGQIVSQKNVTPLT